MSSFITPPPIQSNNFQGTMWIEFFTALYTLVSDLFLSGSTAQRPTTNLFIGMQYFDTTLGKPVFLKSGVGPVWVDATGSVV